MGKELLKRKKNQERKVLIKFVRSVSRQVPLGYMFVAYPFSVLSGLNLHPGADFSLSACFWVKSLFLCPFTEGVFMSRNANQF